MNHNQARELLFPSREQVSDVIEELYPPRHVPQDIDRDLERDDNLLRFDNVSRIRTRRIH